jgi:8-oxo-dGTP pyrophosphatase MutT (NUDIX family)
MIFEPFKDFTSFLKKALEGELPGREAQLELANRNRIKDLKDISVPEDAGLASVLLLFYPDNGSIKLVFIKRAEYEGVHSGQISFPGGRKEKEDIDEVDTALRESVEEIGVDRSTVSVLGKLTNLYIPPSNFLVSPIVGCTPSRPGFVPDPEEVAEIIEVSFADLLSDRIKKNTPIQVGAGFNINAPAFCPDGHIIWGATAMILNELLVLIKQR